MTVKIVANSPSDVPSKVAHKLGITLILINEAANWGNEIIRVRQALKVRSETIEQCWKVCEQTIDRLEEPLLRIQGKKSTARA